MDLENRFIVWRTIYHHDERAFSNVDSALKYAKGLIKTKKGSVTILQNPYRG